MKCECCEICKYTPVQLSHKGTDNPEIYFCGEAMGPEEREVGVPFVGKAGRYLHSIIESFGLNENNCRFFNTIKCYPQKSETDTGFRAPSDEEIGNCIHNLFDDISNTHPKVIVALGNTAAKSLIKSGYSTITKSHGNIYNVEIKGDNYIVIPAYHPSYLMRNPGNSKLRIDFKNDVQKAMKICTGELNPNKDDFDGNTKICLNYKEFDEFCKEEIDGHNIIAYDIETNAEEKTSSNYRVVGFSLASRNSRSCYVVLESIDYITPLNHQKAIECRLRRILGNSETKIIVYNCMHEIPATLNWLGIEMQNVEDIFVMVKLMMGNPGQYEGNGGLKIQCQMNLNINDWSEDLDLYFTYLCSYKDPESQEKMKELLLKYYPEEKEFNNILNTVEEVYNDPSTFKNEVISYGKVPYKLIGKYGGIDAAVLFDLRDFYIQKMKEYNDRMGIDLFTGYEYWMNHHIAGYTLERNGAFWNEERACAVERWCQDGMKETLRNLIVHPLSEPFIREKIEFKFIQYLKDNYIVNILGNNFTPKRAYKSSIHVVPNTELGKELLDSMSIEPNKKGIYKLELGNIKTLAKDFLKNNPSIYENWYNDYMSNLRNNEDMTVNEMGAYLNPSSTSDDFKSFVSSILITDDIKYAELYVLIRSIVEDPNFNMDFYRNESDVKLFTIVQKAESSDMSPSAKLNLFVKYISSAEDFRAKKIKNAINSAMNFRMENMKEDTILELYELYCLCGLDIENRDSWSSEFVWLYNFRMFKKYKKMISTYINGKVGRNSVWYVNKESFSNGDILTRRDVKYWDRTPENMEGRIPILQSSFSVDMADTGRWKAGFHTLPSGDTIKKIYTSRYKGGIIAMPDCAQAEVRVLAAQCQEQNMMQAFKDGLDIHKYVASMIWHNGNQDEVTKTERSIAKGAVFGILYGESKKSFADSFCHGDESEAEKIFNYFFTAFPGIAAYVEESHKQCDDFQMVKLMTDRFINLKELMMQNGNDTDRIYRQAQNFRIQGATCDIAGLILYQICKFIKDNNLKSKPFCFIHDSIEIDIHPDEAFLMLDKLKPLFNSYPWETFGVPMASDIVFSASMGAEIEVKDMVHDEDYNDVTITLEGFDDDIDEVEELWRDTYKTVELISREEAGEIYSPYSALFQKKVTFSKIIGTSRKQSERVYHVVRK